MADANTTETAPEQRRAKASYVGVPAGHRLELACQQLHKAFWHVDHYGIYQVGSSLERSDWRDVDVVMILSDEGFQKLFPGTTDNIYTFDPLWLIMCIGVSMWMTETVGVRIDFKFQPQKAATRDHKGRRNALGLVFAKEGK